MNFLFPYMARWKAVNWTRYHQIFTHLAALGHNVHIIQAPAQKSDETNYQDIKISVPDNLHIYDMDINPSFWNRTFPLNKIVKKGYLCLKSRKKMHEIMKRFKIDVIMLYNIPQYPLMNGNSCITIFDIADDYLDMLKQELGGFSNPLLLKIGRTLFNRMVKHSDITLAVSAVLADSVESDQRYKVKVIPNGVDFDGLDNARVAGICQRLKGPVIGFIGSFEYFIDFDLILDAAQHLPEFTFLLVGSGRRFKEVKEKVADKKLSNIVLTGGVPHSNIPEYINAMDICLNIFKKIPISHGACPLKLFEYISMKKPVISTRLREIEHIDKDFLFYADTVDELKWTIKEILTNKQLVTQYIEKAYNIVKEEYEWGNIVKRLLKIIG